MDCLGSVVDGVQQIDDVLDISDTHFVQASVDCVRTVESVNSSSICENIVWDIGPGADGVWQVDETSDGLATHFGQAPVDSARVVEPVDSGDIGDNSVNSKDLACKAFNF